MKLTTKLYIIITITSLITISIVSYAIFAMTEATISQSIEGQQFQLARQTMDKIDRLLYERLNNIQAISEDEEFEDFLSGKSLNDPGKVTQKIRELSQYTGPWDSLSLVNTKGDIMITVGGNHIIGQNIKNDLVREANFEKIIAGEIFYSDAFLDDENGKPTMIFAAPVRNENDPKQPVVGLVVGHLAWPVIIELIESIKGPVVDLYNKDGVEIANNDDPEAIFKKNNSKHENVKAALEGKEQSKRTKSIDNNSETVSSSALEKGFLSYKGNNWVLLIEQPASIVFAPAVTSAIQITSLFIGLIIISNGLILFLILRVLQPIGQLTQTSKEIALGNLNKRVQVNSKDEIGQLGLAFNEMAVKLQTLYVGLEQKIAEKTTQLSEKVADLERARAAMANVMEDMQMDKAKIDEQKKIVDTVIHNSPIGISLNDPTGKSILVNEAGIALIGRGIDPNARNEDIGKIYQIFRPDGSPYPMEELANVIALRTGNPVTKDDVVVHRPDGTQIAMRITSVPIKNQQGQIVSVLSVFEDITKERDVDRMKTEFISLASHQLRTPLSAIKWFSEMLVNGDAGELTKDQKDFAQNISASAERMIELVNALLNISRIESGRILVDPHPTDLRELVQGVVTDLKAKIMERNQNLVISIREDLPKINLDPHLIRQVFMNLLTNAIKYTPKGGEITVFVSRKDDQIISQVSDNGYGIPKNQQGKMFQKFFRAENIVKIETDGTGLGLYLIKSIIESSKGKIWFQSEEGKGTTFWFSLPMTGMEAKKGEVTLSGV